MPKYRSVGENTPKTPTRSSAIRTDAHAEELMGVEGFSSDSALLYHRTCRRRSWTPSRWTTLTWANRHSGQHPLKPATSDPRTEVGVTRRRGRGTRPAAAVRQPDVAICYVAATTRAALTATPAGDELLYVQSGARRGDRLRAH